MPAPPPPPAPPLPPPEDLGDLKLYRMPAPTTVAARGQKEVVLLAQDAVPVERRYRRPFHPGQQLAGAPTAIVLVMKNDKQGGLGIPLPNGSTALYAGRAGERLLLSLGAITDQTVGETVRLAAGVSSQVTLTQVIAAPREPVLAPLTAAGSHEAVLTANNANPFAVTLTVPIGAAGEKINPERQEVGRIDGIVTWAPLLPPGGRAELRYRY